MKRANARRLPAGKLVVANPGGVSWMLRSAEHFAQAGNLAAYCSPAALHADELDAFERRLPRSVSPAVMRQLALRAPPDAVDATRVVRVASVPEVLSVLSLRAGAPEGLFTRLDHVRSAAFDRAVARRLHAGLGAVIGYHGATSRTFTQAGRLGVAKVLDFPIAHYRHTHEVCGEELRRVPAYAGTMQGPEYARWRIRRFEREIAQADRLIMLSTYHQRTFEDQGIEPSRMFMAHFGVDLELFTPGLERPDGRPFRILFCGQITQRKGISYLVDAFRKAELGNAELVFAGRPVGTRHPWIDEPRVTHIKPVPRPALRDVYRSADVIVLPSLIEGFPSTPLEGMACGLPAIVSEHTFGHDVLEDGVDGWVTPIRDSDAIAEHLCTLYESPERRRTMSQAARRKAEQFTWQRYGEALRAGIEPLLR